MKFMNDCSPNFTIFTNSRYMRDIFESNWFHQWCIPCILRNVFFITTSSITSSTTSSTGASSTLGHSLSTAASTLTPANVAATTDPAAQAQIAKTAAAVDAATKLLPK